MEPTQSSTGGSDESSDGGGNWLFPMLLAVVLVVVIGIAQLVGLQTERPTGAESEPAAWTPSAQPTGETVSLTIDFGNGASTQFAALPWQPDMTVENLMQAATEYRPGIRYTQQGSGESGFIVSLDGLANEGGTGRNWIYRVDDRHAHQSFCLEKLEPGMHVLWTFTDELYNEEPEEQ